MFPRMGVFLCPGFGYRGGMSDLPSLHPRTWNLLVSPSPTRLLIGLAYLARRTDLIVLDCGRQFDSSIVARAARGRQEIVDRIKVQRAFTCYEAVKLTEQLPAGKTPVVILDFLSTFHDENIKIQSRRFLLERSIGHFQRLGHGVGLAVGVHLPPDTPDSIHLFERLQSAAPRVSRVGPMEDRASQLRLF